MRENRTPGSVQGSLGNWRSYRDEGQETRGHALQRLSPGGDRNMNMNPLKRLASRLPSLWQQELKRLHYHRQIRNQTFETTEPEFLILDELISAGDWVIDIGANVGHYPKRLSDLVGPQGRVIAVEPVPETFTLLAANVSLFQHRNVTLLNLAASDRTAVVGIRIPTLATGLKNYYEAAVTMHESELQVLTVAMDSRLLSRNCGLFPVRADHQGYDTERVLLLSGS